MSLCLLAQIALCAALEAFYLKKGANAQERPPPLSYLKPCPASGGLGKHPVMQPPIPVTFLFTDIEGSTKLWEQHPDAMRAALARHDALVRQSVAGQRGRVFKTVGDAFCAAFMSTPDALVAALAVQADLHSWPPGNMPPLRVRMALHTGPAEERDDDYFGPTLNRVARLLAVGHGGQTLLSSAAQERVAEGLPPGVTLRDLKTHRLKDLSQPEHVWQAGQGGLPDDFPPLRSLGANNLPVQMTSFVGREADLRDVKDLLTRHRLLTLAGPGGAGKTRLALQAAAEAAPDDGVWMVDLAPLTDPERVTQVVATVLNVREEPGRPLTQTLAESLRDKELLLILDNCEHLIGPVAALAHALLQSCPKVRLLATSRERLGIPGERVYAVPTLTLPDLVRPQTASEMRGSDAGRLFLDRAALHPGFALTNAAAPALARLCHRLDGIPLAIELAAARTRSLTVEQINDRLDQRFRLLTGGSRTALPRQQTLQGLMDWSYELLTAPEKTLLCRLSVFAGGWTLAATEAIGAGEGIEDWEVLDLLTSLVDKSLVVFDTERYRLLETVRLYARERLDGTPTGDAARQRHTKYYCSLAADAEPSLYGADATASLDLLEAEADNLRAALAWLQARADAEQALGLVNDLAFFWQVRGRLSEGRDSLEAALSLGDGESAGGRRAKALSSAGIIAYIQGDLLGSAALLRRSAEACRRLGDYDRMNIIRGNIGGVLTALGEYAQARAVLEEVLIYHQQTGQKESVAATLGHLGELARLEGNQDAAGPYLTQSLALWREIGNTHAAAVQLNNLARVATRQGDLPAASGYVREAITLRRELGDVKGLLWSLDAAAALAAFEGRLAEAVRLGGACEALGEAHGITVTPAETAERDHFLAQARAGLPEAEADALWTQGRGLTLDQAVAAVLDGPE